ncbi:MAG: TIGR01777 family protein [Myxococcales bacterium]|nr:TIGR01777 family protein [Myxococcales bacterium]
MPQDQVENILGKKIAVTGSSGLIGGRLSVFLKNRGDVILPLVRRLPRPDSLELQWSPDTGVVDAPGLDNLDAVVHLAGENIAQGRWTETVKERLVQSRVSATRLLAENIARCTVPPRVLVSASAIGYYGDRGEEEIDEKSHPGEGFLSELTQQWEKACQPAMDAGVRVVMLRIGVVLAKDGGALMKMVPVFKLGVGGPIGSGRQWMSWITIDDVVSAIGHCVDHPKLVGPVNLTSPNPARNKEFAHALGKCLGRPAKIPVPAAMIRILFGEMGQETVLSGAKVVPRRLQETGFHFRYPTLNDALAHQLGCN